MNTEAFIAHLQRLASTEHEDRGALAILRRANSGEAATIIGAAPHVACFLSTEDSRWTEDVAYTVAGLFASHPVSTHTGSFGSTLRRVKELRDSGSLDLRFGALLRSEGEDLSTHLRHALSLVRSEALPVDWSQLLGDLLRWKHPDAVVQRRWARDYWGSNRDEQTQDDHAKN